MGRWMLALPIVALLGGVVALQAVRDTLAPLPLPETSGSIMYVRSAEVMTRAALSFDGLAADVYWIRALQHYGRTRLSTDPGKQYDQLYPLLDLTTSLDPRFNVAYRFGAIFLSEPFPNGPGRPDLAIRLLEKGLAVQPDRWEFAHDIAFVEYWWRGRHEAAADWFLRAGAMPDAPNWLKPIAAVILAQGGNRASSRQLWQQIIENAELDWLRTAAEQRLLQLDAMDEIDRLTRVAAAYEERTGRRVTGWGDLLRSGDLRALPRDPAGYDYVLDGERGMITLAPASPLNPLPTEPLPLGPLPATR